jgi:hypothetical protein
MSLFRVGTANRGRLLVTVAEFEVKESDQFEGGLMRMVIYGLT